MAAERNTPSPFYVAGIPMPSDLAGAIMRHTEDTHFDKSCSIPSVSQVIFNKLPRLARHYVTRLLTITSAETPIAEQTIGAWSLSHTEHVKALQSMEEEYKVLIRTPTGHRGFVLNLKESFRLGMQAVLSDGVDTLNKVEAKKGPSEKQLDEYATIIWENLLSVLVGSVGYSDAIDRQRDTLKGCYLLSDSNEITGTGFSFLLAPKLKQVWTLIQIYISNFNLEQLTFLSQLAFTTPNKAYAYKSLTNVQQQLIQKLALIGLFYISEDRFYPTAIVQGLLYQEENLDLDESDEPVSGSLISKSAVGSHTSARSSVDGSKRYIILETNYRLYAYTDSNLHVKILEHFSKLLYKLPGMVVFTIMRDTIQEACEKGISAEMIIQYLKSHAHNVQRNSKAPGLGGSGAKHVLPPVVTDSIRIWAQERNRTHQVENAHMYHEFTSQDQFLTLHRKADELNAVIWSNKDHKRSESGYILIVKQDAHRTIKKAYREYEKKRKQHH